MEQFVITFTPILWGLIEISKGIIPEKYTKYIPLLSVLLGLGGSLLLAPASIILGDKVLAGITLGLSAVGLHELALKRMVEKQG